MRISFPNLTLRMGHGNCFPANMSWDLITDGYTSVMYVLVVTRIFAVKSSCVLLEYLTYYDFKKLEGIRGACESAIWLIIIIHIYIFGKEFGPNDIMFRLYNDLRISRDEEWDGRGSKWRSTICIGTRQKSTRTRSTWRTWRKTIEGFWRWWCSTRGINWRGEDRWRTFINWNRRNCQQ